MAPVCYNDWVYASKSEAKIATPFDLLKMPYQAHPNGPHRCPDFKLSFPFDHYVEVKPEGFLSAATTRQLHPDRLYGWGKLLELTLDDVDAWVIEGLSTATPIWDGEVQMDAQRSIHQWLTEFYDINRIIAQAKLYDMLGLYSRWRFEHEPNPLFHAPSKEEVQLLAA